MPNRKGSRMGLNWLEDQAIGPRRFSEAVLNRWAASGPETPLLQRPDPTGSGLATGRFSASSRPPGARPE
jgi:hypothetical protein